MTDTAARPDMVADLVWHKRKNTKDEWADTDVGRYEVGLVHGAYIATRRYINEGQWDDDVFSVGHCAKREARAAAQADYAARIASALSPAFLERIAALEAELEKVAEWVNGLPIPTTGATRILTSIRTTLQEHAEDGERQGDEG